MKPNYTIGREDGFDTNIYTYIEIEVAKLGTQEGLDLFGPFFPVLNLETIYLVFTLIIFIE